MGGMWVPVPSIHGRKLPACLRVLQGWLVWWLDMQRGSQSDSYLPLGQLVLPGVGWSWHVSIGVIQPGKPPQIFASLMAVEQRALASQMVQVQVVLASLTVVEQRASASSVAWVQMALASLMDSVVAESFWQSSMPSSQTAFCLWALMDDVVTSSSPRALLAFSQRWLASAGGVPLLGPGASAMGEMAVGISSREVSAISASSRALTWDDVSTSLGRSLFVGWRCEYDHGIWSFWPLTGLAIMMEASTRG